MSNQIKEIQGQGYKFLKDTKKLEDALDLAWHSGKNECVVTVKLTPENSYVCCAHRSERKAFDAYVAEDLTYAEITILPDFNRAIAQLKFNVDNLFTILTDNSNIEAITGSLELSLYRCLGTDTIEPFFVGAIGNEPFRVIPDNQVREILGQGSGS